MVGKLDYSKWDNLELSDDSDVEVHPNVDKRSFIRWKQRDIHEKRDQRKMHEQLLEAEFRTNGALRPRIAAIKEGTAKEGAAYFSREVARLSAGRQERGNKDGPHGPTQDDMMLSLLLQINDEAPVKTSAGDASALAGELDAQLQDHLHQLDARQAKITDELEQMRKEDAKKITSDSLHEGFSASMVAQEDAEAEPAPPARTKVAQQEIETLNPKSASHAASGAPPPGDSDEEEDEAPTLTPAMRELASLPSVLAPLPLAAASLPPNFLGKQLDLDRFQKAFQFLGAHKELLRESSGAADALLVQAFEAQMARQPSLARACTEKALLIQYCNKLGRDGVSLFFKRMLSADQRAATVFLNDVLSTYRRIADRAGALSEQYKDSGAGVEQIQLMAEDPNTVISFQVPEGPPPEHISLEGEGAEAMDTGQVRAWLLQRWEIFSSFPADFRRALETKSLEQVNQALGRLPVDQAERIVQDLDSAGILNFSSTEVRDETKHT
ncbi:hsp90 co-chaperone Cdc37 [Malassezia sp. CBS 17886]|nr:hsp90 co-chaperone Cdc37 [Malassezia sp. CBS 17886]